MRWSDSSSEKMVVELESSKTRTATCGSRRTSAATSQGSPIARITQDGVITEGSKPIDFADPKRPDPVGITIGANGDPWYAESLVDKVANLKLR